MYAFFLACISDGKKPQTDGREGLRVLKILKAGQRSLDNHGCKISFSFDNKQLSAESDHPPPSDKNYFVHETAIIDEGCKIGSNSKIWHFSHVLSGSKIGDNCNIGQNVVIGPDVKIGNKCKIQNNVSIYKGTTLENGVFCGPSMVFTNVYNPRAEISKMDQALPTLVKRGSTIGANATIICGVTLGSYCFIGAGSVVTKSVQNHSLVFGNPAKQVGWMCKCGERLTDKLECTSCGAKYHQTEKGIEA